jgi:hypothetical protein
VIAALSDSLSDYEADKNPAHREMSRVLGF